HWTREESRMQGELQAATQVSNEKLYQQGLTYEDLTTAASTQLGIYKTLLQERAQAESESAARTAAETGAASGAWQTHVSAVDVSLDEYARRLDEDTRNKESWRQNIVDVTDRGGVEVGQILRAMGEEGADLAADLATATDAEFNRMKTAMIANARAGGSGAADEMETFMKIMAEKGRQGGEQTAQGIADKLRIGVGEVARIAHQYGVDLAGGINPILSSLGKATIQTGNFQSRPGVVVREAEGGVLDSYANRGVEDHVAQIARAGDWRVWAEPETPGEALIPLAHHRPMATHPRLETTS
nr:hypothetical protein [Actinomycetota bacterium]